MTADVAWDSDLQASLVGEAKREEGRAAAMALVGVNRHSPISSKTVGDNSFQRRADALIELGGRMQGCHGRVRVWVRHGEEEKILGKVLGKVRGRTLASFFPPTSLLFFPSVF